VYTASCVYTLSLGRLWCIQSVWRRIYVSFAIYSGLFCDVYLSMATYIGLLCTHSLYTSNVYTRDVYTSLFLFFNRGPYLHSAEPVEVHTYQSVAIQTVYTVSCVHSLYIRRMCTQETYIRRHTDCIHSLLCTHSLYTSNIYTP